MTEKYILLTNDDGIQSPGLWAAAQALASLGKVYVTAPRDQCSGAGRSLLSTSDGLISTQQISLNGTAWTAYSVGGTPAQAVLHGIFEVMPRFPDLVVSGINYGENPAVGVTASGTVGAALEAAARGIPALAISLETDLNHHLSYSTEVDFTASAYFTAYFGGLLLQKHMPDDVRVLKVDVPITATPETPWVMVRLSRKEYFEPLKPNRDSWDVPRTMGYRLIDNPQAHDPDTDVYALRVRRLVTVTPLSLDLTSRVDMGELEKWLRN